MNAIDPVRLAAVGLLLLLVVAAAVALTVIRRGQPHTAAHPSDAAEAATAPTMPDPTDVNASGGTPATTTSSSDDEHPPASAQDLPDAEAVAADFVQQWATSRYDEPPKAAIARIRPYVTRTLAALLRADLHQPGGAAGELEEVTDAVVEHVHGQAITGEQVTLVVIARQHTRTVEGDTVGRPAFTLRLAREGDRWRVHELVH